MATPNAISPELLADSIAGGFVLARKPSYLEKAHRVGRGMARVLRSNRRALDDEAWRHTIQIALPFAGSAVGFILLFGISLVQG